nr:proline-rich nuclear receptor coactivator [Ipomoea batatas]
MGTEILRPQDCLGERVNPFHRRKNGYAVGGGGAFYPRNNRKQVIRVSRSSGDVYAGSGFSNSPSPRSLPLSSFFNNANKKQDGSDTTSFDDSATRDLRRLLRLE